MCKYVAYKKRRIPYSLPDSLRMNTGSQPNSRIHRKMCNNISIRMNNKPQVVKETKEFSRNIQEKVSYIKNNFIEKNFESMQREYLVTCSYINIDDFDDVYLNSMNDFIEEEREFFTKYLTRDDVEKMAI